ncbi:MAG: putative repeat protein [Myxococcaceae bacterium]|nr:putative repeat protein [Myxococcaceae bacterium]
MKRSWSGLAWALGAVLGGCGGGADVPSDAGAVDAPTDAAEVRDVASGADAKPAADAATTGCEGVRRSFWTWNLRVMPPPDVELAAGCRAARPHVFVFAPDEIWGAGLDATRAEAIARAFEESAPADPTRGIYAIETGIFGDPPDLDGDPHVVLLYQDMGMFRGFTFDGFFRALDESATDPHSNATEMLHLDAVRMDPTNEYMLGVVAHEFVHMLASQYGTEDVWLSETLAEAGMVLTGYLGDLRLARAFAARPTAPLVGNAAGMDYGPLFLFGDYLVERYGAAAIGDVARSRARGVASVEAALATRGGGTFRAVFVDWTVANLVDAARPPYGYAAFDVTTEAAATRLTAAMPASASAPAWAAGYSLIDFGAATTAAEVTIDTSSFGGLVVHAAVYDPAARADATVTAIPLTGATTTVGVTLPAGRRRLAVVVANASATAAPYRVTVTTR